MRDAINSGNHGAFARIEPAVRYRVYENIGRAPLVPPPPPAYTPRAPPAPVIAPSPVFAPARPPTIPVMTGLVPVPGVTPLPTLPQGSGAVRPIRKHVARRYPTQYPRRRL